GHPRRRVRPPGPHGRYPLPAQRVPGLGPAAGGARRLSRLAHLTDIHFGGENPDAVAAALEELRREPPRVTAITGDITSVGAVEEFDRAAAWIRALPEPVVSTPGNHDTPYVGPGEIIERLIAPFRRWERRF